MGQIAKLPWFLREIRFAAGRTLERVLVDLKRGTEGLLNRKRSLVRDEFAPTARQSMGSIDG
jgi:hypothetical protein